MTHPAVYVVTIGIAIGAALFTYFMPKYQQHEPNRQQHEPNRQQNEPRRRRPNRTFNNDDVYQCALCRENIPEVDMTVLFCRHRFHERCISGWYSTRLSCPICDP